MNARTRDVRKGFDRSKRATYGRYPAWLTGRRVAPFILKPHLRCSNFLPPPDNNVRLSVR